MCTHDSYRGRIFGYLEINTYICTHDSWIREDYLDYLRLIRTYVPMILIRQDRLVHFRLIRTYVRMILIRQDVLVTLD